MELQLAGAWTPTITSFNFKQLNFFTPKLVAKRERLPSSVSWVKRISLHGFKCLTLSLILKSWKGMNDTWSNTWLDNETLCKWCERCHRCRLFTFISESKIQLNDWMQVKCDRVTQHFDSQYTNNDYGLFLVIQDYDRAPTYVSGWKR